MFAIMVTTTALEKGDRAGERCEGEGRRFSVVTLLLMLRGDPKLPFLEKIRMVARGFLYLGGAPCKTNRCLGTM
jgi:hypothetical protein